MGFRLASDGMEQLVIRDNHHVLRAQEDFPVGKHHFVSGMQILVKPPKDRV